MGLQKFWIGQSLSDIHQPMKITEDGFEGFYEILT